MKIKLLLILGFLVNSFAYGQLNGNYTIGGSTPDYPTFGDAVSALVTSGVSGPVIFDVRNGVYQEKIVIPDIPNSSSVNTITFQSEDHDSSVVMLFDSSSTASTSNFTLQLNGGDWITFKQIGISRPGANTYGTVINIANGSTNNRFLNNLIIGNDATTSTTSSSLFYSASGATSNDSNTVISNNRMVKGSYGLYMYGASASILEEGNVIDGNIFENQYGRAMNLGNMNFPHITNNTVTTNSVYATFYSLYLTSCENNMVISGNKFDSPAGAYGIYFTGCDGSAGLPINVFNNFIHTGGTGTAYGMYITTSTNMNVWYNSIHVSGTGATSRGVYVAGAASLKLVFQNNVIANTGGGHTFYVITAALPAMSISDYNDLYSSGSNLAFWDASNVANLSDWKTVTSKDQSSVSVNPIFASAADLHCFSSGINNLGIPIPSVTTDIDGDPRSGSTPDIGADEFVPLTDNLSMNSLVQPSALGSCGQTSVTLEVSIGNLGSNTQSAIPIVVEITGAATQTIYDTIPGPVNLNTTVNYTLSQTLNTVAGGEYFFKIYTSLAADQFRDNDTLQTKRLFYEIPNDPTAVSPQQGCNTSVGITASPDTGDVILWYDEPSGGNLVGVGSPLTVPITSDTVFYAEARQGGGSTGCLRIVECELGNTDYFEIQNLSSSGFDATGWTVAVSNNYADINSVNPITWSLGYFNGGEIQYKTDGTDHPWGNNILWNPGNTGWIVLLDAGNNVRDFVAFLWTDAQIQAMAPLVNGVPITIGTEWTGDGTQTCGTTATVSRIGNSDNNNAADFACETATKGTQNVNMAASFANCGIGLCGSGRVAVQVNMVTGVSTSLGPDTTLVSPFSYPLDAGTGFTSYLWSDGSTGQTLTATAPGIYWVTVSGSNGCSFTDSVEISIFTGIQLIGASDRIQAFPNPANQQLSVQFTGQDAIARISDINGRVVRIEKMKSVNGASESIFDLNDVESGLYFVQVVSKDEVFTMKLLVQHK